MAWKSTPFSPTREQTRIAQSDAARILIEANAGVGKTTTLCMRALWMVEQGADPSRMVMLTYTAPGSEAIHRTLKKHGASAALRKSIRVGTFDEFCTARLLRVENVDVKRLARPEEVKPFVLAAIAQAREECEAAFPGEFSLGSTGESAVESLLDDFERIKGTLAPQRQWGTSRLTPSSAAETGFDYTTLAIFQAHERLRRVDVGPDGEQVRFRYVGDPTYDLACMLVADDPAFTHDNHPLRIGALHGLFVDEFHDMSWAMATVLRGLMEMHPDARFTGVGDVDQVIHAASGAESYFLRGGFELEFGHAERMLLTQAQRFGRAIAEPLQHFAGKPYPWHPGRDSRIAAIPLNDALELALHIQTLLQTRKLEQPKSHNSELAVLLRHPNAALDLEYELLNRGIDYETAGFTAYMSRPEVLFVRMILAAAVGSDSAFTETSLLEAKQATWEFIGGYLPLEGAADPQTASKIRNTPVEIFQSHMIRDLLGSTARQHGARCVLAAMDIASDGGIDRLLPTLKALCMRDLARHVFVNAEAVRDAQDSVMGLGRMVRRNQFNSIDELLRTIRMQEERMQGWTPQERIVLSTIGRAKGLEFDHVIIPGVNRGEFDGDDEDERHLFYVAVSRARRVVELVHRPGAASIYVPAHLRPGA
ncbi:MAG TPA: ATP-dependent helicase [Ideonella sp.]|nr:ATP-dependent helicase [Ideonella sp.]